MANRLLAISPVEEHTFRSQSIKVGRAYMGGAIAVQFVTQIIRSDKQDIRLIIGHQVSL